MAVPDFPTLDTARLHLREITPDDAPALLAIHGDAQHMRWFGADTLTDLPGAQALVELFASWRRQPNPGTRWALTRHGASELIGTCGLFGWNRGWGKCTLGYELAPTCTRQGYMHEALVAVLDWGFREMALHRVEAMVHPDNAASLALLARLGFVQEGRLREVARWNGEHHDMLQLGLLRREWPPQAA